jgi:hypothetical protein|tara:strand:+ start:401 stop:799 length:399 start_codon:yes stop_codon:yes gene_type:complete
MEPIPVTVAKETTLVPRLKVQEIISLSAKKSEEKRIELLADLNDSQVDSATRFEALKEFRENQTTSMYLVRSAFTVEGAVEIIASAMGGEFPAQFKHLDPNQLTTIAANCLGFDMEEVNKNNNENTEADTGK